MEITQIVAGMFYTNTYLLVEGNDAILIDPASKAEKLYPMLEGKNLLAVLLTHGHFDHIKAVDELEKKYNVPVYIHKEDEKLARDKSQRVVFGLPVSPVITCPVNHFKEGPMEIGPFKFNVLFTPGHSKGSVCFEFEDSIFTGDTLFKNSVGRTDLYGGNETELKASLKELKKLNPELEVFPGHDDTSKLSDEIKNNPYM